MVNPLPCRSDKKRLKVERGKYKKRSKKEGKKNGGLHWTRITL
jgi:hypothetical protein